MSTGDTQYDDLLSTRGISLLDPFPAVELSALAADVEAIRMGFRPSEAMLAQCPAIKLPSVSTGPDEIPCLIGELDGQLIRLHGLAIYAPEEGWARLLKGYVRVEQPKYRDRSRSRGLPDIV